MIKLLVCVDNVCHQLVANHVFFIQKDELYSFHIAEDVDGLRQSRRLVFRQVNLRHVASDDELRVATHTGEEHLQLSTSGILRLV